MVTTSPCATFASRTGEHEVRPKVVWVVVGMLVPGFLAGSAAAQDANVKQPTSHAQRIMAKQ
jgi:hypothetical protein